MLLDSKRLLSLCSVYQSLLQLLAEINILNGRRYQKLKGPQSLTFLIWLIPRQRLPTSSYLLQCEILEDDICAICKEKQETILHVVRRDCPWIQDIWQLLISRIWQIKFFHEDSVANQIDFNLIASVGRHEDDVNWHMTFRIAWQI